jgi:hypothetical protein
VGHAAQARPTNTGQVGNLSYQSSFKQIGGDMPSKKQKQISGFPKEADKQFVQKLWPKFQAKRAETFREDHNRLLKSKEVNLQAWEPLVGSFNPDKKKIEEAFQKKSKAIIDRIYKEKPAPYNSIKGHNPTRYAPFDEHWSALNCGGFVSCSLRGPDISTGQIGANIGTPYAGDISATSSLGFWYWSQQQGTLLVDASVYVWGRAAVYATIFGYAYTQAAIRLYIEQYTSDFQVFTSSTDIYAWGSALAADIRDFNGIYNVRISLPIRRDSWYCIWTDAICKTSAGGIASAAANFDMHLASVTYAVS